MGTPRYFHAFWLVFVGGCSFSASCGGKTLNTEQGEKLIAGALKEKAGMDATVTCPRGVKLQKDAVTECAIKLGEVPGKAKITQTDDKGNVSWEIVEDFVITTRANQFLGEKLGTQIGQAVTVDCGPEAVRASEPGKTFRCKATAASGDVAQVEVTITDKQGAIDAKIVQ